MIHPRALLAVLTTAVVLLVPVVAMAQAVTRTLVEGFGTVVNLPRDASSIFIGDPSVADVRVVSGDTVFLAGIAPGVTNAFVLGFDDTVIRSFLITVVPNNADATRIISTLTRNDGVRIVAAENAAILKGVAGSLEDALANIDARRALEARGRDVIDRTQLQGAVQVSLKVRFVEASRSDLRQLGVDLSALGSVDNTALRILTGSGRAGGIVGDVDATGGGGLRAAIDGGDIDAVLTALDRRGVVEILSEPTLTTTSGRRANFRAGGEFAIPVPQGDGVVTAEYREFGVSLDFLPTVLPNGRIALEVTPEVSFIEPGSTVAVEGFLAPNLSIRRAQTTVEVGSGQTFAIAGLYEQFRADSDEGIPGLRQIRGLGRLFGTGTREERERELVIFITPFLAEARDVAAPNRAAVPDVVDTVGFIVK